MVSDTEVPLYYVYFLCLAVSEKLWVPLSVSVFTYHLQPMINNHDIAFIHIVNTVVNVSLDEIFT